MKAVLFYVKGAALLKAISAIPDKVCRMSQEELGQECRITAVDENLKAQFNKLAAQQFLGGPKIGLKEWANGCCTYTHLFNNVINNPYRLAWILWEFLGPCGWEFGLLVERRVGEILNNPVIDKDGNVNSVAVNLLIRFLPLVEDCVETKKYKSVKSKL